MLDLTKLQTRIINELTYDDVVVIDEDKFKNTDIRKLSEIKVHAVIKRVTDLSYNMVLNLKGEMILPCAITLKDVKYPFDITNEIKISNENEELDEDYVKICGNSIDILEVIWQNILLEIPIRVVSSDIDDEDISGDGWKLIRE